MDEAASPVTSKHTASHHTLLARRLAGRRRQYVTLPVILAGGGWPMIRFRFRFRLQEGLCESGWERPSVD
jgi:hypothetical protein